MFGAATAHGLRIRRHAVKVTAWESESLRLATQDVHRRGKIVVFNTNFGCARGGRRTVEDMCYENLRYD
jgi:hypothetical protein